MKPAKGIYKKAALLDRVLCLILQNVSILAFCIMTMSILIGVVMRFILKAPNMWGEELSRYSMVVGVFFATALAVRDNAHMRIDMLVSCLPKRIGKVIELISRVIELAAYIIFIYICFRFVKVSFGFKQISPSLQVPMYLMYLVLLVGFILSSLETILSIWNDFIAEEPFLDRNDETLQSS